MLSLASLQIGLPRSIGMEDTSDRSWTTGFFKEPVNKPVWLGQTNLVGDGQADLKNHGGTEKAVLAYATEHYLFWCQVLNRSEFPYGAFGENFTVEGQTEASVCIGDVYQIGEALIQVSQPRKPCWKISQRWQIPDLALQVQKTGKTGWYFRVLQEGFVEPNQFFILRDRSFEQWTIARANEIIHHQIDNTEAAMELGACPLLAPKLQEMLLNRALKSVK